jgi:hypothetical protein
VVELVGLQGPTSSKLNTSVAFTTLLHELRTRDSVCKWFVRGGTQNNTHTHTMPRARARNE